MKSFLFIVLLWPIHLWGIVGGELVPENDPVALSTVELSNGCSGTLIADNWVLTAAHCLVSSSQMFVRFSFNQSEIYEVERIILHPSYRGTASGGTHPDRPATSPVYDIGLLKLAESVSDTFQPVKMILESELPTEGSEVLLAGFGVTNPFTGAGGGLLRQTTTIIHFYNEAAKEVVFGPTPGQSACPGDSGGPMYLEQNGELLVMGVTSRGFAELGPCSGNGNYTSVVDFEDWILLNLERF